MESWSIKELNQWLKTFDNPNSSMNYFLGGASKEEMLGYLAGYNDAISNIEYYGGDDV